MTIVTFITQIHVKIIINIHILNMHLICGTMARVVFGAEASEGEVRSALSGQYVERRSAIL